MDQIIFTRETFEVAENGTTIFPVTLIRSGDGIGAVTTEIKLTSSTKAGRCTFGKDYTNSTVTVTWADGEIGEKIVDIGIIDDGVAEPIERVNLSFGEIVGAVKGAIATCVVAIQDSTNVTPNPKPNQIINLLQSDYAIKKVAEGLVFNEKLTKNGIELVKIGDAYNLDVTLWKATIPQNFGDVHSVSIAYGGGGMGSSPGMELVGLVFSYEDLADLESALNVKGFTPQLRLENNNLTADPYYGGQTISSGYSIAEIQIDGVDVNRRYAADELVANRVNLSDLKTFYLANGKYAAISILPQQEFIIILDQTLKTSQRSLYLYLTEGGTAGEIVSAYLNPVPQGFSFPPIKPGTTPKYFGCN